MDEKEQEFMDEKIMDFVNYVKRIKERIDKATKESSAKEEKPNEEE